MCVVTLGPRAVRSAFHGRQHKVIRRQPPAGAAPRSLSCPHSFSVSRCPALTGRQGGTDVQSGQTPHLSIRAHLQLESYIWTLLLIFWDITRCRISSGFNWRSYGSSLRAIPIFIFNSIVASFFCQLIMSLNCSALSDQQTKTKSFFDTWRIKQSLWLRSWNSGSYVFCMKNDYWV